MAELITKLAIKKEHTKLLEIKRYISYFPVKRNQFHVLWISLSFTGQKFSSCDMVVLFSLTDSSA